MLEKLKEQVFNANLELVNQGLVIYTWGNVSGRDPESNLIVIKPSGVDYSLMKASDMVVVDLEGHVIEGTMKPSSDLPTHLELYKAYFEINGIVHTHSEWATAWAQSGKSLACYGTTHADYFYGPIPCTRLMEALEIQEDYEKNTGKVIIETLNQEAYEPLEMPGILVLNHGPFTWGKSPNQAVHNAKVLEEIGKMNYRTLSLNGDIQPISQHLLDKHYLRKHGKDAYYGQR